MEQRTYIVTDPWELDALVQKTYNRPDFESAEVGEWSNDSCYAFCGINGKLDERSTASVAAFKAGGRTGIRNLLNDMAASGVIEAGDYLIDVSY